MRVAIVVVGFLLVLVIERVPAPDSMTSFTVGGLVGLILGAVLGAAYMTGEREQTP